MLRRTALALGFAGAVARPAPAAEWPDRPVKVIVPYSPGAAADVIGRIVAQKLSELTHTQFYVENLPGASGTIGTGTAAHARADGYTILVMNVDFVVQPVSRQKHPMTPSRASCPWRRWQRRRKRSQ